MEEASSKPAPPPEDKTTDTTPNDSTDNGISDKLAENNVTDKSPDDSITDMSPDKDVDEGVPANNSIIIDDIVIVTQASDATTSNTTSSNAAVVVERVNPEISQIKIGSVIDKPDHVAGEKSSAVAETEKISIADEAAVIVERIDSGKSSPVAETGTSDEAAVVVECISTEKQNVVAETESDNATEDNQQWTKLVDGETADNNQWTKLVQQLVNSVEKTPGDQGQQEIVVIVEDSAESKENKVDAGDAQLVLENGDDNADQEKVVVIGSKEDQALSQLSEMEAAPSSDSPVQDVEMESLSEFRCWYCEEVFDTNGEREDHEKMHTESRFVLLICQQCGQSFRKSEDFEAHHQVCGTDNDDEGDSFNDADGDLHSSFSGENSNSQTDRRFDNQDGQFECVFCDTCCSSKAAFKKHLVLKHQLMENNSNPKWFCCKYCDESCTDRDMMLEHESSHKTKGSDQKANKYQCSFCKKNCHSRSNLVEHLRMHTGEKPYSCPHCGKSCSRERDVKEHIKRMHPANLGKQLTCEYCYVIFVTRKDLIDHLKNIHNVKKLPIPSIEGVNDMNYICSECGKEFDCKAKRQFEEHIATHTRDNLFSCDECGKTFVRARELRYHKARHRGEGRYVCGLCHKNFVLKWDLKKHLKTIHDIDEDGSFDRPPPEKRQRLITLSADNTTVMDDIFRVNPYICRVCHAQFEGGKELRAHRKTHLEEEGDAASEGSSFPYICSFCSKGFQNKNDFVEHVGTHTKGTFGDAKYTAVVSKDPVLEQASPPVRRPKKQLEKGEGVEFWKCCYGACLKVMKVYTSKEEFEAHIKSHRKQHTNICEFCGRCFARTRDLTYHKKETGVRPCKYMNVNAQDDAAQEVVNTEEPPVVVEGEEPVVDGEESTKPPSSGKKPVLIAPKPPAGSIPGTLIKVGAPSAANFHTCGCGKQIQGFKDFQLHVLSHKSTRGNVFCQYCGQIFKDQDNLQKHLNETKSDKPCTYASYVKNGIDPDSQATSGSNQTKNGSAVVVGNGAPNMNMVLVQPVKLELAKNVTVLPANLVPVQQVRSPPKKILPPNCTVDKPYACSYCGKAFRARSYVREHETLHTKEANFECDMCDRRFTRARELRYHMRKHTGDEPYKCDVCGKRFLNQTNFRTHMEKEHETELDDPEEVMEGDEQVDDGNINLGSASFKCTFCSKHFTLLEHFKAHMEIVHDVEVSVVSPDDIPNVDKVVETDES